MQVMPIYTQVMYLALVATMFTSALGAEYRVQCGRYMEPANPAVSPALWVPRIGLAAVEDWGVKATLQSAAKSADACKAKCDASTTCAMYQVDDDEDRVVDRYADAAWKDGDIACHTWEIVLVSLDTGNYIAGATQANDYRITDLSEVEAYWDTGSGVTNENFQSNDGTIFCSVRMGKSGNSAKCPDDEDVADNPTCFTPAGLYVKQRDAASSTAMLEICGEDIQILNALSADLSNTCIHPATHGKEVGQTYVQTLNLMKNDNAGTALNHPLCEDYKVFKEARDQCAKSDAANFPFYKKSDGTNLHITNQACATYVYGGCLSHLALTKPDGVGKTECCKDTYANMKLPTSWDSQQKSKYETAARAACQSDLAKFGTNTEAISKLERYFTPWQWDNNGVTFYESDYCENGSMDLTAGAPLPPVGSWPFLAVVTLLAVTAQDLIRFYA